MEQDQDKESPFPREPWQRLLESGAGEPPETTDARIRAAARRARRPRAARWWLPASLAASFLLAVMVVRWQYDDRDAPAVMTETDVAVPPAAITPDRSAANEPAAQAAPPAELRRAAPPAPRVARPEFTPEPESEVAEDGAAMTGARIRGPERDLRESSERPVDDAREAAPATAITSPTSSSPAVAPEPEYKAEESRTQSFIAEHPPAVARRPSPEDWYAEIEKLRAAGRTEEADRELERLKEAYPGWLERHLEQAEKR